MTAAVRGYAEIVQLALAAGADAKSRIQHGGTALISACKWILRWTSAVQPVFNQAVGEILDARFQFAFELSLNVGFIGDRGVEFSCGE